MESKDYRLEIKVKNGLLWRAMADFGHPNPPSLSKATGINAGSIYKFMNLQMAPINRRGKLIPTAARLCDYFGVSIEELFPEEVLFEGVKSNKTERWVSSAEAMGIGSTPLLPDEMFEAEDTASAVRDAMDECLSPRHARVLRMRYGIGGGEPMTLGEVADCVGVTRERVRQIEQNALRKLRHPNSEMRDLMDIQSES